MEECIFCKIVNGEINSEIVYEDDKILAFKDVNPQAPVHILIIPKEHIPTVMDIEDTELVADIYKIAQKLAREYDIADDGFRVVVNCNDQGGQVVYHIHFHLLGGKELSGKLG